MSATPPLVLASASPRRSEILTTLEIAHEIHPADVDETPRDGETPEAYVERLARAKAEAVAREHSLRWIVAGDTVVALGEQLLGKPGDAAEAVEMLLRLQGRLHRVISSLTLVAPRGAAEPRGGERLPERAGDRRVFSGVEATVVRFRSFDSQTARAYAATGEPMDKAGAYGIQGRGGALVERIEGDYSGVVGLPVSLLVRLLDEAGRPYRFDRPAPASPHP